MYRLYTYSSIFQDLVATKGRKVRLREVEGYSSSYYHIPSTTVQRAAVRDREEVSTLLVSCLAFLSHIQCMYMYMLERRRKK